MVLFEYRPSAVQYLLSKKINLANSKCLYSKYLYVVSDLLTNKSDVRFARKSTGQLFSPYQDSKIQIYFKQLIYFNKSILNNFKQLFYLQIVNFRTYSNYTQKPSADADR